MPSAGAGYELVVNDADGTVRIEPLENGTALIDRALDLRSELVADGWRPRLRMDA